MVVGAGHELAQVGAGDGAADQHVQVRCEPALGLEGGPMHLHVVAHHPAHVLPEPVDDLGESNSVAVLVREGRYGE